VLIITCCVQKVVLQTKSCYENKKLIFGRDGTPYPPPPAPVSATRLLSLYSSSYNPWHAQRHFHVRMMSISHILFQVTCMRRKQMP
jgi:hypothetical protein